MATVGCCPSPTGNQHQCHSLCHHHHRHKDLICQMYTAARRVGLPKFTQVARCLWWIACLAHLRNPIIAPLTKASTSWPVVHLTAQPVQTRKSKVVRTCCGLKPQPGSAPMHPNPTATQIWLHAPFLLGDYMKNQGPGRHKTELRIFLRTSLIIYFNPN